MARRLSMLAADVRRARKSLGWRQERLAEEAGADVRAIRDFENGTYWTGSQLLSAIAVALKLDWRVERSWDDGKPLGRHDVT